MLPTNTRIKQLRKALDLTQTEFARRIGTTQNAIASYETGRRNPSSSAINNICKEFCANEEWLRTGSGEMFTPAPSGSLEALARDYNLSNGVYLLIRRFLELRPETQEAFVDFAVKFADDLAADQAVPVDQHAIWEAEARAEAEQVYREILQEKRAEAGLSASPYGSADGTKGA